MLTPCVLDVSTVENWTFKQENEKFLHKKYKIMKIKHSGVPYLGHYCCQQLIPDLHSKMEGVFFGFVLRSESPCFLLARMECQCAGETE